MKFSFNLMIVITAATLALNGLNAQEAKPTVKVDVKDLKPQEQKTPQFQVSGLKDHAWRQKTWLEIDLSMDVKKAKVPGDNTSLVDSLEAKFYIALNQTDANKKYYLLTGTMTLQNIPTKPGEHAHALVFVSPSTLQRLLGENKQLNAAGDIKALAVEINHGGQLVGGHTTSPGKWWEDLSKFAVVDGAILPKSKTPFAPLWGDYDVDVKTN